jgi:hypothetical protein
MKTKHRVVFPRQCLRAASAKVARPILICLLLAPGSCSKAPGRPWNPQAGAYRPAPDINSAPVVWGDETNGMRAALYVEPGDQAKISVFLRLPPGPYTNAPTGRPATGLNKWPQRTSYYYFRATDCTNSFVGPIELRDPSGRPVPLLHPEVAAPATYPPSYSLHSVYFAAGRPYENTFYSGPGTPPHGTGGGWQPIIVLTNYFKLNKPGQYRLTVRPRVYRRVGQEGDLCYRVDLPPVTTTLTWSGKAKAE